jgi:hypothetical protein
MEGKEDTMKMLAAVMILLMIGGSCTTMQDPVMVRDKNLTIAHSDDMVKHDIVVLDPGFDTWFITNWSPAKDRTLAYYDGWNDRYVSSWNYKATHPGYASYFQNTIDYNPNENYGLEVSRKLYYYFRYVEIELNIQILDIPRPSGII